MITEIHDVIERMAKLTMFWLSNSSASTGRTEDCSGEVISYFLWAINSIFLMIHIIVQMLSFVWRIRIVQNLDEGVKVRIMIFSDVGPVILVTIASG